VIFFLIKGTKSRDSKRRDFNQKKKCRFYMGGVYETSVYKLLRSPKHQNRFFIGSISRNWKARLGIFLIRFFKIFKIHINYFPCDFNEIYLGNNEVLHSIRN
jgi:hypothetical protein